MSGISYIKRIVGATNNLVYVVTSDSTATATASNYITNQAANILVANEGAWTWEPNDCIMLSASDGISWCSINVTFTTITAFADSLTPLSHVLVNNAVNTMQAGSDIALDKGTGTVVTNAVTVNHQAGVVTTGALTTASGTDATAITLTNSFISSSSVIVCQIMGGTNTTNGVTIKAVPGSGSASITLTNGNVSAAALNGTVIFSFVVF